VANGLDEHVQEVPGVVKEHQSEQENVADSEGDHGQALDASVDAGEHGKCSDDGDDEHDHDFVLNRRRVAANAQAFRARQNGCTPETKRSAYAEHGARDGKGVDAVADDAPDHFFP